MSENLLNNEEKNIEENSSIESQNSEELIIPEKFKDKETGELNVNALLKSYLALEKKLSERNAEMPSLPNAPEEYEIVCNHNYFIPDTDINQKLLEAGFSQEQAQLVYDIAEERMIPMIIDIASSFESDKEKTRLEEKFGGKEKWSEVSRQLLQYGKQKLPPQVLEGLSSTYDGIVALYNMMNEDAPVMSVSDEATMPISQEELYSMMKDERYWRKKDPQFVNKVTEGFKKFYN